MLRDQEFQNSLTRTILLAAPIYLFWLFYLGNTMRYQQPFPYAEYYSQAQYLFDWRDWGFVKRGLIATLFPQTPETAGTFAAWFGLALGVIIVALSTALLWISRMPVVLFLLMASPFFVYQLGFMLGRLDAVGIIYFLGWLLSRELGWDRTSVVLYALSPLMLFVHEVFLLTILSAMFMVHNMEEFSIRKNLVFGVLSLAAVGLILVFGKIEQDHELLQAYFQHHYGEENLTQYVLTWSFAENFSMNWERHMEPFGPHSAVTVGVALVFIPVFLVIFEIERIWVFLLATAGFFCVYVLGHDWARWTALYISHFGIALCTVCNLRPVWGRLAERFLVPLMILSVIATPSNVTRIFTELLLFVRDREFYRLLS
ncbi:MAG: hypothetical protein AAGI13_14185 [Pseudomonadota bacterium]